MLDKTEEDLNKEIRRLYEPRYKRKLTDEEVAEIRRNLRGFAEAAVSIIERLHKEKEKN